MKRIIGVVALLLSIGWSAVAVAESGVEKLYILNCGEGVAGDISRWSPGVNEGQSMPFVDNCYLIKHAQGWFLWDTGIPDAVASMPDGLVPPEEQLGQSPRAGAELRQGTDLGLDGEDRGDAAKGQCAALDQPRQGPARHPEAGAGILRLSARRQFFGAETGGGPKGLPCRGLSVPA